MDIHITNETNKSWEAVYVIEKVRQLFSKHESVRLFGRYRQKKLTIDVGMISHQIHLVLIQQFLLRHLEN